jgi:prepilin-type N-terminal cleavage/methylation domain-containing protein
MMDGGRRGARRARAEAGVTLIEMTIVVTIIGIMAGLSLPLLTSGLDALRLSQATDNVASFLNSAMNRVERRSQIVEIVVSPKENVLALHSTEPGFVRRLDLPASIKIAGEERQIVIYPGASFPRVGVELKTDRGARRIVRMDPTTGVPQIERP